jgi:hypothetical protein
MKNIAENNLVRFISITKKKNGLFANFRVKGIKGGATFSSSISIDVAATEVTAVDPLEKIIEECARVAIREFEKSTIQFEGVSAV